MSKLSNNNVVNGFVRTINTWGGDTEHSINTTIRVYVCALEDSGWDPEKVLEVMEEAAKIIESPLKRLYIEIEIDKYKSDCNLL